MVAQRLSRRRYGIYCFIMFSNDDLHTRIGTAEGWILIERNSEAFAWKEHRIKSSAAKFLDVLGAWHNHCQCAEQSRFIWSKSTFNDLRENAVFVTNLKCFLLSLFRCSYTVHRIVHALCLNYVNWITITICKSSIKIRRPKHSRHWIYQSAVRRARWAECLHCTAMCFRTETLKLNANCHCSQWRTKRQISMASK